MRKHLFLAGVGIVMITLGPPTVAGQNLPLVPLPSTGLSIAPFLEGWYANEDGSHTISFGYLNRNEENLVNIQVGENNSIEPAQFSGMQPTVFLPGRHRGVFVVTLPPGMEATDVWWTIANENGEVNKVPGRTTSHAYQLDRNPRPFGSLPPHIGFSENGPTASDPSGILADQTIDARVGEPLTLEVWTSDPSQRDPDDTRFEEAKSLRVVWSPHQSPPEGDITFSRHESSPEPEEEEAPDEEGPPRPPPGPEEVMVPEGAGVARVYATFSAPGEYLVRAQVDNWRAPDSSSGDQCCWSNAYQRVNVEP
ncbi:MAG: hypothetical protein GEU90_14215 [Gemmatimonas sp.]|nr:hypothetical protein [Gemmatimonas sp.]